jgi:hypothetical protein
LPDLNNEVVRVAASSTRFILDVVMPQYYYSPLSHKLDVIRLLRLLPSKDKLEDIQCELLEYTLQESENPNQLYEALSYVWGDERKPKSIFITGNQDNDHVKNNAKLPITENFYMALSHLRHRITGNQDSDYLKDNAELPITENLYTALIHLRHRQFPRILWVDAVCIDQGNQQEKEHQIQLMPAIYTEARIVIVWLGDAQDDGGKALDLIRIAGKKSTT